MTRLESRVRALLSESGITGPDADELTERLTALEQYVDDTPPEPSPQLAVTMARKAPALVAVAPPTRRRGRLLVASLVAVGAVGAGGVAAAANELPPSAQDLVADLSERYLPFNLPRPTASTADEATPAGPGATPPPSRESPVPGSGTRSPHQQRPAGLSPTVPDDPALTRSKAGETSSSRVSPEGASAPLEEPAATAEPAESRPAPGVSTVDGGGTAEGTGSGVDGARSAGTPDSSAAGAEGRSVGGPPPAAGESSVGVTPSSGPSPATARGSSAPPSRAEEQARDNRGRAAPR